MLEGAIAFLEQQHDDPGDFRDADTDATDMSASELIKEEEYAGDVHAAADFCDSCSEKRAVMVALGGHCRGCRCN